MNLVGSIPANSCVPYLVFQAEATPFSSTFAFSSVGKFAQEFPTTDPALSSLPLDFRQSGFLTMASLKNRGGGLRMIQYVLFVLSITCVLDQIHFLAHAADPDPLQDFCVADMAAVNAGVRVNGYPCKIRTNVSSDDFAFTGLRNKGNTSVSGTGAVITFALVGDYPALNTQGISHVRLDLEPGGVIPLHSHPLATETIFVVEGTVLTGFVSHDNKLFSKTLEKGDMYIFPRGLLHFQENVGRVPAICFNSFNAQFPALLISANQLFATNISMGVLTKSFGANQADMKHLADVLPRYWG